MATAHFVSSLELLGGNRSGRCGDLNWIGSSSKELISFIRAPSEKFAEGNTSILQLDLHLLSIQTASDPGRRIDQNTAKLRFQISADAAVDRE